MIDDHRHDRSVIVCSHVMEDGLPVLLVAHELDGDWQFLCGSNDHIDSSKARVACFGCMMTRHPGLEAISDLRRGEEASREHGDARWERSPTADEETIKL